MARIVCLRCAERDTTGRSCSEVCLRLILLIVFENGSRTNLDIIFYSQVVASVWVMYVEILHQRMCGDCPVLRSKEDVCTWYQLRPYPFSSTIAREKNSTNEKRERRSYRQRRWFRPSWGTRHRFRCRSSEPRPASCRYLYPWALSNRPDDFNFCHYLGVPHEDIAHLQATLVFWEELFTVIWWCVATKVFWTGC